MNRKPRILFFPFPLQSHYLRCGQIAAGLQYSAEIFFPFHSSYQRYLPATAKTFQSENFDPVRVMRDAEVFSFNWLNYEDIHRVFLAQVKVIRELEPDLIVADVAPALKMAAEHCGIPLVSVMNAYMSKYYARTRCLSQKHPACSMMKTLPEKLGNAITAQAESWVMKHIHKPFRQVRNKYQLNKVYSFQDECEGDLNLLCDLPELFPQRTLPENYKMIEPLFFQGENEAFIFSGDPGKRTIVVSCGSSGDWEHFRFLSDPVFAKYNVIFVGAQPSALPPHIQVLGFVCLHQVLQHSDLLLCHGGNGSIYSALAAGVPVLCAPSHFEQEYNVQGLKAAGTGDLLVTSDSITGHEKLINEWIIRKNDPLYFHLKQRILSLTDKQTAVQVINDVLMTYSNQNIVA